MLIMTFSFRLYHQHYKKFTPTSMKIALHQAFWEEVSTPKQGPTPYYFDRFSPGLPRLWAEHTSAATRTFEG